MLVERLKPYFVIHFCRQFFLSIIVYLRLSIERWYYSDKNSNSNAGIWKYRYIDAHAFLNWIDTYMYMYLGMIIKNEKSFSQLLADD